MLACARMLGRLNPFLLSLLALSGATLAAAQAPAAPAVEGEMVDRVLAVVDEDPILESDLQQVIGLGLAEPVEGETEVAFRRRVLDRLIEQRLQFHEIDQFGFAEIPVEEVERQFEQLRLSFGGNAEFEQRLEELGLDGQGLRQVLARQLMVLIYVEERLGARVFVDLDEIRDYYESTLVPDLRDRGQRVPPIQEIREQIRSVLKERRLNEEIVHWTDELRREADVLDYFDSQHDDLPPVVKLGG